MLISQSTGKFLKRKNKISIGSEEIDLTIPIVMGIVNVTPDSFYDGGKMNDENVLLASVEEMVKNGVTVLDIGGVSTKPGSQMVSTKTELERLLPAVYAIRKNFPDIPISIDTFRSWVAVRIMDEIGPVIVNDVSGGSLDTKMFETIGRLKVPYILSHIQGTPATIQENPQYEDIIIDPGFGFGKNLDHNYELLNRLDSFKVFQLPVMVGLSRKSMIWKALEITPETALNGTTVANTLALMGGADILRVHDVKEAVEVIKIFCEIKATIKI